MPLFSLARACAPRAASPDRDVDRVKLMIAGDLLRHGAAAKIFEHNEVAQEIKKAPLIESSLDHDLEFRQVIFSERLARDRAPRLEPLPARAERTDARLDSVRNQQRLVVSEQRLNLGLVGLQLLIGIPDRRVLVRRILQLHNTEWKPVDEDDHIRSPVVFVFDDGELIDGEPVVVVWILEIDQPRLRAANRRRRSRYSTVTPSTRSR